GEVLAAGVDAGVEHQLGEHRHVGGRGEQPGVPGDTGHGVERLLVVHLTAQRVVADVDVAAVRMGAEGDVAVPRVAVELGGGDLVRVHTVVQGAEVRALQAQGAIERLVQVFVQAHSGDLLHDQPQDHEVQVAVGERAAR